MAGQQMKVLIHSNSNDLNDVDYTGGQDPHQQLIGFQNVLGGVLAGAINAQAGVMKPATAASATGTMTGASVVSGNAVKVCGVTFSAISSGIPTAIQFLVGASDNATMQNLANAINANATTQLLVYATLTGTAVVTLTSVEPGVVGNQIPFSQTSGATITCTGSGFLTSGAGALVSSVAATTATATLSVLPGVAVGNYVIVGGVTFTAVAAFPAAVSPQPTFQVGTTDVKTMANLASAINACPYVDQKVTATAAGLVVTLAVSQSDSPDYVLPTISSGQATITASSPTFTAAPVIVSGNTVVIDGVTFSATASTQDTTHFEVGTTDNATLTNLLTSVAANGTTSAVMTGTVNAANSVTLTAAGSGPYYNTLALAAGSGATIVPSGPTFTGGALSYPSPLHFGY
jgi:hypothetical protein